MINQMDDNHLIKLLPFKSKYGCLTIDFMNEKREIYVPGVVVLVYLLDLIMFMSPPFLYFFPSAPWASIT